jgi:hypothetical protein
MITYYIAEGEQAPAMPNVGVMVRDGYTIVKCSSDEGDFDGWQKLSLSQFNDWENEREHE